MSFLRELLHEFQMEGADRNAEALERALNALEAIAAFPIPEQDNQISANMRLIAKQALMED